MLMRRSRLFDQNSVTEVVEDTEQMNLAIFYIYRGKQSLVRTCRTFK